MFEKLMILEADGHISPQEAEVGIDAHLSGAAGHTIGYEVEVFDSAENDTPCVVANQPVRDDYELVDMAERDLGPYGYKAWFDGMYELISPHFRHPLALGIATRGVVDIGWLPESTKGIVTSHVSIGYHQEDRRGTISNEELYRLINILRAVELAGGATSDRLYDPIGLSKEFGDGKDSHFSWNSRGVVGVNRLASTNGNWEGENGRIEFRTLRYQSLDQFEQTLMNLYFLSRGILGHRNGSAPSIHREFEEWFEEYRKENDMPDIRDTFRRGDSLRDLRVMEEYIVPYINSLGKEVDKEIRSKVLETVQALAEEYGMNYSSPPRQKRKIPL